MTDTDTTGSLTGLDDLCVTIEEEGEDEQPWTPGATVYKYSVTVEAPEGRYTSSAWGSQHDYSLGERRPEEIGWMVLDELLSAAYDPDEFFAMSTGGDGGRDRAEKVLALIATAEQLLPALERNQDAIEAER